jgi:hypothetical protein
MTLTFYQAGNFRFRIYSFAPSLTGSCDPNQFKHLPRQAPLRLKAIKNRSNSALVSLSGRCTLDRSASLQPVLHSPAEAGVQAHALHVRLYKIRDIAQRLQVTPFIAWHMGDVTSPSRPLSILALFSPDLHNE